MAQINVVAPRLPNATVQYDQRMVDELLNILRLYFNRLDNFTQLIGATGGGQYLSNPLWRVFQ